jgi:hypothetical protein
VRLGTPPPLITDMDNNSFKIALLFIIIILGLWILIPYILDTVLDIIQTCFDKKVCRMEDNALVIELIKLKF